MVVVSVLNAARNSFSFFLLLIVCMGYGVVKPTLGKTMIYVRWLAAAHLVFGIIYAVASLTIQPDDAGPIILLVILPLSATLTAFYIWTLNSLNYTIKDLVERKQHVKAGMYKSLWYCILTSILVIFGFFFFNSFAFASSGREDFAPRHWQTRWFVLDGWLNIVYLGDIAFVAWVWRPTPNNRRFAMSEEVIKHPSSHLAHGQLLTLTNRSHKMTKASSSGPTATVWTLKTPAQIHPITHLHTTRCPAPQPMPVYRLGRTVMRAAIAHLSLHRNHRNRWRRSERAWTATRYSRSVKIRTISVMRMAMVMRGRD